MGWGEAEWDGMGRPGMRWGGMEWDRRIPYLHPLPAAYYAPVLDTPSTQDLCGRHAILASELEDGWVGECLPVSKGSVSLQPNSMLFEESSGVLAVTGAGGREGWGWAQGRV